MKISFHLFLLSFILSAFSLCAMQQDKADQAVEYIKQEMAKAPYYNETSDDPVDWFSREIDGTLYTIHYRIVENTPQIYLTNATAWNEDPLHIIALDQNYQENSLAYRTIMTFSHALREEREYRQRALNKIVKKQYDLLKQNADDKPKKEDPSGNRSWKMPNIGTIVTQLNTPFVTFPLLALYAGLQEYKYVDPFMPAEQAQIATETFLALAINSLLPKPANGWLVAGSYLTGREILHACFFKKNASAQQQEPFKKISMTTFLLFAACFPLAYGVSSLAC